MPHVSRSVTKLIVRPKFLTKHIHSLGCGHCKKAKPEFKTAAETFKDDPRVELAAVDCTRHSSLCSSYSVSGYPTIKYFSYLKTQREYSGGRTVMLLIKLQFRMR